MTQNAEFATVLAQAQGGQEGGSNTFMLIMLAVLAVLFIMMIRRSRKAMKTQQEQRASLEAGQQVMTTFGLYGTITEIDHDDNKVTMELSPGHYATVHLQAVGQVVEEDTNDAVSGSGVDTNSADTSGQEHGSEYTDPRDDRDR